MNYRLIAEILHSPWLIDGDYALGYTAILRSIFSGEKIEGDDYSKKRQNNKAYILSASTVSRYELNEENIPDGSTAVIPIRGEIMKYPEMCGPRGTINMVDEIQLADANPKITSILLIVDSPGGQVAHTDLLAAAIKNSTTPIVAYVEGVAASAAYWIISGASKIIASSELDRVGSIGTMCSFADFKPMYEEEGVVFHEIYATKSTDKNKDFRDILAGKYDDYRKGTLDFLNEKFHESVKSSRANISKDVFSGKMYFAKEAIELGLIDEIGTIQYALDVAENLSKKNHQTNNSVMKMKIKSTWLAIMSFFGMEAGTEHEIDETQLESLNNQLQTLNDQVSALTTERDNATSELSTERTSRETAEGALAIAQSRIQELESENATLRAGAGATTANVHRATETAAVDEEAEDEEVAYARNHTSAEFTAWMRERNAKK